ncbi:MAG: S9 family peptidase [Pseudonocardia sp.]
MASAPPASVDGLSVADGAVYWIEGRPHGDVLVRWSAGRSGEVLPPGVHVASAVHEYGGGAYLARSGEVWFVRTEDQRIWRTAAGTLVPVTPQPRQGEHRHADLQISPEGPLICVRERHHAHRVDNELVSVPADGSAEPRVIAQGWDFYSSPRITPNGSRLAWLTWNRPLMPWDGSWLWVADLDGDGVLGPPTLIAGGPDESVTQPQWSPDGILHFLSDRTGWWNLHRHRGGHTEPVIVVDAELGPAPWEFGYVTYQFLDRHRIAVTVQQGFQAWLGVAHNDHRPLARIPLPYTSIKPYLAIDRGRLAIIGATPTHAPSVALIDPSTANTQELTRPRPPTQPSTHPQPIRFPTQDGGQAHAVLHPATPAPSGGYARRTPPLIVRAHPGPTANTHHRPDPWITFFTSHGFTVLDVDYRGSTGYGRAYRNALRGCWGVLDVADCVDAVDHLATAGRIDPTRVAVCGSSAGGYTALRAVATTDTFAAATVRHAIVDPATWRESAPKFQAHHTDLLIAPPSEPEIHQQRSVLHHVPAITAPVLIIHGEQDAVTPVAQARRLASALGARAILITFPDEAHGLRHPDHANHALHAELGHYRRALRP